MAHTRLVSVILAHLRQNYPDAYINISVVQRLMRFRILQNNRSRPPLAPSFSFVDVDEDIYAPIYGPLQPTIHGGSVIAGRLVRGSFDVREVAFLVIRDLANLNLHAGIDIIPMYNDVLARFVSGDASVSPAAITQPAPNPHTTANNNSTATSVTEITEAAATEEPTAGEGAQTEE